MTITEIVRLAEQNPDTVAVGQRAFEGLVERADSDGDFRSALLADPVAALSDHFGREVDSSDVPFYFVDEGGELAVRFEGVEGELTEDQLEAVAGGTSIKIVADLVGFVYAVKRCFDAGVELGRR